MQVSIETLTGLERKMTIEVPSTTIESQVQSRLQEAARTFEMKGFRKGKVPIKVIKNRFGRGVRQEVVGEVMSQSYYEAVNQEKVRPAGQPKIEPKNIEEGKDLEFVATFEVYPEITLGDFSAIEVDKKTADITEADIDNMIETLRKQRITYAEAESAAREEDQVDIDFVGKIDGEEFAGGSGKGTKLVLGSKRMIEGFEDGLIGAVKGDEKVLALSFPENYHNKDLAGKAVEFTVQVNSVSEPVLPELNDEFFASFDVSEGGEKAFRTEVKSNMARELKNASKTNVKNQVIEGLLKIHSVEVPKSLTENEINVLRQQAMQQFGGAGKIDPNMLPAELFQDQAERRVILGLVMNEIIVKNNLQADPAKVKTLVEELAESYEDPSEVVKYYYSNKEQLAQVEAMAMEDAVIDHILAAAKINETSCDYEEALKAANAPVAGPEAEQAEEPAESDSAATSTDKNDE